ncbi:MAG: methylmalonyl-CoA mutase [Rhodobiaceae bacterium]|nr:methylmalonyl-CoA mutase [Rhodobiaceae bacterium]MCC0048485.1 methylmalonyl-CoA mutase [Rhodobiaceae bacterium]
MSALGLDAGNLAGGFSPAGEQDWRAAVEKALKGADFDKVLTKTTRDGYKIQPLYPQTVEAKARPARAAAGPWTLSQRVDHPHDSDAAHLALADLEGGADGLVLVGKAGVGARGFGAAPSALATRLDGVMPELVRIRLDAGTDTSDLAAELAGIAARRGDDAGVLSVDFGFDPLAAYAATGATAPALESWGKELADLSRHGFAGTLITGDGRAVHDAGGTPAQELAYVLATLVEALRAGGKAGLDMADMSGRALAILSADADIFPGIAKLRAMRLLWARVLDASSLPEAPLRIEAETAWRMMSRADPYVNLLRVTAAVSAAGLGGADGVTVLPHTLALGLPDGFARRVARNIQNVLTGESNLYRVADPAGGSGYIEAVTQEMAEAAWKLFQRIEAEGGAIAAMTSDSFPKQVAEARAALEKDIARRKVPLTGVSEFPNIAEKTPAVLMPAPEAGETGLMPAMRVAALFEAFRDRADAAKDRPTAFLAAIGNVPDFNARAMFAANALAAGGIAAKTGDGGTDAAEIASAALQSGSKLAVICSSDALYADHAVALVTALKSAGVSEVWLAGRGGEQEAALKGAGVTRFIYAGCDILEMLDAAHAAFGG